MPPYGGTTNKDAALRRDYEQRCRLTADYEPSNLLVHRRADGMLDNGGVARRPQVESGSCAESSLTSGPSRPAVADRRAQAAGVPRLRLRRHRGHRQGKLDDAQGRRARRGARGARSSEPAALRAGTIGIAHTRWATHGEPTERNAHPHSTTERHGIALVHNGIIENYAALQAVPRGQGPHLHSETDTEVLAHLIGELYDGQTSRAGRAGGAARGHRHLRHRGDVRATSRTRSSSPARAAR